MRYRFHRAAVRDVRKGVAKVTAKKYKGVRSDGGGDERRRSLQGLQMKNALALIAAAAFAASGFVLSKPALAHDQDLWPDIPAEVGVGAPPRRAVQIDWRCSDGAVLNFYHGAWYGGQPPAVYLGNAYRPFYRYTAYRVVPRTYFCSARQ